MTAEELGMSSDKNSELEGLGGAMVGEAVAGGVDRRTGGAEKIVGSKSAISCLSPYTIKLVTQVCQLDASASGRRPDQTRSAMHLINKVAELIQSLDLAAQPRLN